MTINVLNEKWSIRKVGKFVVNYSQRVSTGVALCATVSAISTTFVASATWANPTGGVVTQGSASITYGANQTNINQTTNSAAINWSSFNVSKGQSVDYTTPTSTSVTLNRIDNGTYSLIDGNVHSTGRLIFINPNGFFFGNNANVNATGLVATTSNISDADFANSAATNNTFSFNIPSSNQSAPIIVGSTAQIITNKGSNGVVALVGAGVENNGTINSQGGDVILAAAKTFCVDLDGDALINIEDSNNVMTGIPFAFGENSKVTTKALDFDGNPLSITTGNGKNTKNVGGAVLNDGNIHVGSGKNGGTVLLASNVANSLYDNAINNDGVITATHLKITSNGASGEPTQEPTGEPTQEPTGEPTQEPTGEPTQEPTGEPTPAPTGAPGLRGLESGNIIIDPLNRPVLSLVDNSITYDRYFEGFDTKGVSTNLSLFGGGNTGLANIEPAAGGNSASDLSDIEPAAGGGGQSAGQADNSCGNNFLDNKDCETPLQ